MFKVGKRCVCVSVVLSIGQPQLLFPKNCSTRDIDVVTKTLFSDPVQTITSPGMPNGKKVNLKLYKVNVVHSFYFATRGHIQNIFIYNRAHHLKAFSGLKINCCALKAGSGDERMNRPHGKTRQEIERLKREGTMLSGRGLKLFSELRLKFKE